MKSQIRLAGKCPECGEAVKFEAYLMKASKTDSGICYTSGDIDDDQEEVPPERALYSYETHCPRCGNEIEGVLLAPGAARMPW